MGGAGAAGGARRGARTVRLSIELGASNEDRYPELSYRDLVADTERKKKDVQNGKKLEAFSDNDDDVARMAKQFEQKYGSMSTYGQRGRSKKDEFADIGAGYDENDSFIDNTDGYDEMIPPECDTYHGGFYINCGSLEFKSVPENQLAHSDNEAVGGQRTNKRRISSSTSEDSSSESSSESDAGERQIDKAKDGEVNGAVDSHKTDRRKMKDKNEGKKKTKKRRLESGATSGKQTSDEARLDGESADSRTSHSDSLTSKPAPSSENVATSDSSREVSDAKPELKLPPLVGVVLEELTLCVSRLKQNNPGITPKELEPHTDPYVLRLEQALATCDADVRCRRAAWVAAAKVLNAPRTRLLHRARALAAQPTPLSASLIPPSASSTTPQERESKSKKNAPAERVQKMETESSREKELTPEEKEKQISEILECLRTIIEQMKPEMIQTYKMECERIQEENKKIALANAAAAAASEQAPRLSERRLPKRRFPWCSRVRSLLAKLVKLCGGGGSATGQGAGDEAAARLLAHRVLPMFPPGFVRLPTLLRQANLNKDLKVSEIKKQKIPPPAQLSTSEPKLPSSSSVTITSSPIPKLPERSHSEGACGTADDPKLNGKPHKTKSDTGASSHKSTYNSIFSSFTLSSNTDVCLEKHKTDKEEHTTKAAVTVEKVTEPNKICLEKPTKSSENDKYMPPNSIGSITITPVTSNQKFDPRYQASKLANNTVTISSGNKITTAEPSIRVRSPAEIIKAANAMSSKDEKHKSKPEPKLPNPLQIRPPDKHSNSPLVIDTSHPKKDIAKCHSPNFARQANGEEGKKIDNIPRPGLIPVHHSPTFVKPAEKRLTEQKKTKDCPVVIVSDLDPLQDVLHVDDSSSDVELVEEIAEKPPDPSKVKTKIKNPESAKTTQPVKPADTEHHIQKSSSLPPSQASNHNLSSSAKEFKREDLNSRGPKSDDGNPRREHEKSTEKRDDTSGKIREDYNKDSIREYSSDKVQRKEHFDKHRYDSESSERQKRDNTAHSVKSQRRDEHSSHSDKSHKREEYTSHSENHKRNEYANHQDRSQRKDEHGTRPDKRKDDYSEKRKNEHASLSDKIKDAYASHSDKRKDENSTPSEKRKDEYYSHSEKRKDEYPSHSDKRRDHQAQHSGPRKDDYEHSKSSPDKIKRQDSSPHKETGSHSESHNRDQQGLKMPAGSESGRAKLDMKMDVEDGDIDIDKVMRGLRDLQSSQEPHFNNDSFGSSVNG